MKISDVAEYHDQRGELERASHLFLQFALKTATKVNALARNAPSLSSIAFLICNYGTEHHLIVFLGAWDFPSAS